MTEGERIADIAGIGTSKALPRRTRRNTKVGTKEKNMVRNFQIIPFMTLEKFLN
jgi:hypothetical protein